MSILSEIIRFEHKSEHVFEHNLKSKKLYSAPKIYNAKGDLAKRWYVYFRYRNPKTGKLERLANIYGDANKYTTKEERLYVLVQYQKKLLQLLEEGFIPNEDNTVLLEQRKLKQQEVQPKVDSIIIEKEKKSESPKMSIKEAFTYGLSLKEKLLSPTTKRAYENRLKHFLHWVEKDKINSHHE